MSRLVYSDAAERERMHDVMGRMRPPFSVALGILIVPAILAGPVYGWLCLLPLVAAVLAYLSTDLRLHSLRHLERWVIGTWAFAELMILLTIALADGPRAYLLAVPIIPMVGVTMIVGRRVAFACAAGLAALLCTVAALTMWPEVAALPPILIAPVALIFASAFTAFGALDGGFISRRTSVVDPLTGLPDRVALQTRATELAAQARIAGERVALIVVEVDDFDAIRDEHGGAVADAVLAEVARRLRSEPGSGTVCRFGGSTFVTLCPGVTRVSAIALAERLRTAVRATPVDDIANSASIGIAVYCGDAFDFAELFSRGAAAAACARTHGGNTVCLAPDDQIAAVPEGELPPAALLRADATWHARLRAATNRSLLMPDAVARAHAVDGLARTQHFVRAAAGVLGLSLVVNAFWLGWHMLVPAVAAVIVWELLGRRVPCSRRPEYLAFAGLALIIVATGVSAALAAGTAGLYLLPAVAVAVLGSCSCFPRLGAVLLAAIGLLTTVAAGLAIGAAAFPAGVVSLALSSMYVVGFAIMGETMGRTAREHRVTSITDATTGLLNPAALDARIPALEQLTVDRDVTLVLLDVGDDVSADTAALLRDAVPPFVPPYRLGGGEIALFFPDMDETQSARTAARLAAATHAVSTGTARVSAGDVCSVDALIADARASRTSDAEPLPLAGWTLSRRPRAWALRPTAARGGSTRGPQA
jgi:diguanylate cyclase (GGDEF)-like protein